MRAAFGIVVGKPKDIVCAYVVVAAKRDQMMDGQSIYAVFVAGIHLLRSFQDLCDIGLLQTAVLP